MDFIGETPPVNRKDDSEQEKSSSDVVGRGLGVDGTDPILVDVLGTCMEIGRGAGANHCRSKFAFLAQIRRIR